MRSEQPVFLISDLHLNAEDAATHAAFSAFMVNVAPRCQHLYVLGDLFEYWPGDDDDDIYNASIIQHFLNLSRQGVLISVIPGNRDILMGHRLMEKMGARLLSDPSIVSHFGIRAGISHGDLFCTDDTAYQAFRSMVHAPGWKDNFLSQPLAQRRAIISGIRQQSEQSKQTKSLEIMDVNAVAIEKAFSELQVETLIHGHTHRPGMTAYTVLASQRKRWVLPDWQDGRAGYLQWDTNGLTLISL